MNVLVVSDAEIVSPQTTEAILDGIKKNIHLHRYAVRSTTIEELAGPWENSTFLVIVPSFVSTKSSLPSTLETRLSSFVNSGGKLWTFNSFEKEKPNATFEKVSFKKISLVKNSNGGWIDFSGDGNSISKSTNDQEFTREDVIKTEDGKTLSSLFKNKLSGGLIYLSGEPSGNILSSQYQTEYIRYALSNINVQLSEDNNNNNIPSPTEIYLLSSGHHLSNFSQSNQVKRIQENQFQVEGSPSVIFSHHQKTTDTTSKHVTCYTTDEEFSINFDSSTYFNNLQTGTIGRYLLYSDVVESTQKFFDQNWGFTMSLPNGFLYTSRVQTSGKGRGNNVWISPKGQLCFSLVCHYTIGSFPLPFIQYAMALAVVESVRSRPGYSDIDLRIKWPNDIYLGPNSSPDGSLQKIGGILITSSVQGKSFVLVIGVGVNVANDLPTTSINQAIRLHNQTTGSSLKELSFEEVLSEIMTQYENFFYILSTDGFFKGLSSLFLKRWLHSNQKVSVVGLDGDYEILGIDEDGYLKAKSLQNSQIISLQPDGNSFDMTKNLIQNKI
eukprot:c18128_g3_i1.p1 GENE.c18128_g3_i1~~c18128_g3_i1.p1  ORF type:complete len:553 (+),score=251.48 c18128_g3_i1:584-2242(+)